MDRRLALLPLAASAALVFACGPHPRAGGEPARLPALSLVSRPKAAAKPTVHRVAPDSAPLDVELAVATEAGVQFALTVANDSKHRVEVNFPDGRTREFVVYDDAGRAVWRWSEGRLFTQSVQNKLLAVGDSVVFAERWTSPTPGHYTVVAQLRSDNFPIVRRAEFVVPGAATQTRLAAH